MDGMFATLSLLSDVHAYMSNRWHVFTAIGGYIGVVLVDLITSNEVLADPTDRLAWPVPMAARLMTGTTKSIKEE